MVDVMKVRHILFFLIDLLYMIQAISRKNNRDVLTPEFVQEMTRMCIKGNINMVNLMKL